MQQCLKFDRTLQDRTNRLTDDILNLLSLCLNTTCTYFSFYGVTYQQMYGTTMGPCVHGSCQSSDGVRGGESYSLVFKKLCFWKRYVDDVYCSTPGEDVNDLLAHLNSIELSIQFTCEAEKYHHLSFLDIFLMHNLDGTISTSVYHKPTPTDRYVP